MTVAYISNADCGRHDTGWGHPEHVGRLRAIPQALREDAELFARLLHHESRHASPEEIALAHGRGTGLRGGAPRLVVARRVVRRVCAGGG